MKRPPLVILAGGKGTRLRSVTGDDIPKPMVDVFGLPFLYLIIEHYIDQGFKDITISTGHLAEEIETFPWPWGLTFVRDGDYKVRRYPQGFYSEDCIIVNGDTWIENPLPKDKGPWILCCSGVDAGAQRTGVGKIKVIQTSAFYDIGTPAGLEQFKRHLYPNRRRKD